MKNFLEQLKKLKYLLPFIGSFLATLAGQGFKYLRRVTLPIILSIVGIVCLESMWGILLGTFGIWASVGYGIPDRTYPEYEGSDSGSTIGRFWTLLFRKYFDRIKAHKIADVFVRGTVGLGMCLTGLVCPILKENWLMYFLGCLCIMIGQTVFSYRSWGFIPFKGKELLWSDLINYFLIFSGYVLMLS